MSEITALLEEFSESGASEEAILDRCLFATKLLLKKMEEDQVRIDAMQAETRAILADIQASMAKQ